LGLIGWLIILIGFPDRKPIGVLQQLVTRRGFQETPSESFVMHNVIRDGNGMA